MERQHPDVLAAADAADEESLRYPGCVNCTSNLLVIGDRLAALRRSLALAEQHGRTTFCGRAALARLPREREALRLARQAADKHAATHGI